MPEWLFKGSTVLQLVIMQDKFIKVLRLVHLVIKQVLTTKAQMLLL